MHFMPSGGMHRAADFVRICTVVALLFAGGSACGSSEPVGGIGPPAGNASPATLAPSTTAATLQSLNLATGDLVPAFDPAVTDYTMTALTSLFPVDVTVEADPGVSVVVNGAPASSGTALSVQLAPREDIFIAVTAPSGDARTFTVHYLPPDLPGYEVTKFDATKAGNENVLLTPNNAWLLMTNREGDPLYYRNTGPYPSATDFKELVPPVGSASYSFWDGDGKVHLLDSQLRELSSVALLANRTHDALTADLHDSLVLGEDHYVLISYARETVDLSALSPAWDDGAPVIAGVVQEVDHGNVVFEWHSTDVPSLYADSTDGNGFKKTADSDYVHMNAVGVDPIDGNFIVSLRHTNSVLKLNRKTGATMWTLGGSSDTFALTPEQRFSHQHHAKRLEDGTLLLFDNGNNAHPTRVLAFTLDEAHETVSSFHVIYDRPGDQDDSTFMGSAFRMDASRYLIGWGGRTAPALAGPAVTEIVDGAPVWSLAFTGPTVNSYRAAPAHAK
jgi:hypothetical protein